MHRLEICINCKRLGPIIDGRFTCKEDGEPIVQHADKNQCPLGKFELEILDPPRKSIPLAGDLVASITAKFGIDRAAKFLARMAGKPDCGCGRRTEWLNKLDRRIRQAIART